MTGGGSRLRVVPLPAAACHNGGARENSTPSRHGKTPPLLCFTLGLCACECVCECVSVCVCVRVCSRQSQARARPVQQAVSPSPTTQGPEAWDRAERRQQTQTGSAGPVEVPAQRLCNTRRGELPKLCVCVCGEGGGAGGKWSGGGGGGVCVYQPAPLLSLSLSDRSKALVLLCFFFFFFSFSFQFFFDFVLCLSIAVYGSMVFFYLWKLRFCPIFIFLQLHS